MLPSKLQATFASVWAKMKAALAAMRNRADIAARNAVDASPLAPARRPLTFEEHIERLLILHAPHRPWFGGRVARMSARRLLRRKRREFFLMFDRFKGAPDVRTKTGEFIAGRPALLNRSTRRFIAGRLNFAV